MIKKNKNIIEFKVNDKVIYTIYMYFYHDTSFFLNFSLVFGTIFNRQSKFIDNE